MRIPLVSAFLVACLSAMACAYDVPGAKPITKLAEEAARAKASKKLLCIVYVGSMESCPHCAAAAANGVKAVRGSAELVVIKQAQAKDKAFAAKFTPAVQEMLARQPTGAWVSFNVFDAEMQTLVASAGRELEADRAAARDFAAKVRAAKALVK